MRFLCQRVKGECDDREDVMKGSRPESNKTYNYKTSKDPHSTPRSVEVWEHNKEKFLSLAFEFSTNCKSD